MFQVCEVGRIAAVEGLEDRRLMAATVLAGTGFGTAGAWNSSGATYDKALDGNVNTYFDSTQASGAYVGMDLGSAKNVTAVQLAPRTGLGWRMVGAKIQGSNTSATAGFVDLGTVNAAPAEGQLTTITLTNPGSYRWVRYVSPDLGYGNLAEVKFMGDAGTTTTTPPPANTGNTKLTGTGIGSAGSWAGSSNTADKALDGNPSTYFDAPTADGAWTGLDLGTAKAISSVRFYPRAGLAWRMTGGTFQGSNDKSSWTTIATVATEPAEGQYATLTVTNATAFRYVRYVSPASGFGNVAEVEFYGGGSTTTTPTPPPPITVVTPPPPTSSQTAAGAPQAVLTLMESSVTAGMSIHADAVSTTLNAGSPVTARYEWNFGDPNGKYNTLVGFNAAHVYDTPGVYTVTLKVTNELGLTSTVTKQVTINADTRRTIYVDSSAGNDSNDGSTTSSAVRTAARAFKLLGNNAKILFKRGQTFGVTDFLYATYSNITIGAYGSGANPTLLWQGPDAGWYEIISPSAAATTDMTVENLSFNSATGYPTAVAPRGKNITIRNCSFQHLGEAMNASGNPTGLLVQDNVQPANSGVQDYFLWLQGTDAVVVGNNVAAGSMYAIRTSGGTGETITRALFANNTLSNDGRSNLRVQKGSYCYAVGNTITNSGVEFGPLGSTDGFSDPNWLTARSQYDVLEGNVMTLTNERYVRLSTGAEHISVRNNVIRHDGTGEAISIEGYDPAFKRQVVDAYILNNTVIDYSSIGQMLKLVGPGLDAEITVENNLYIAPNLAIGRDGNAPVYVNATNLSTFRSIRDNVWALPGSTNAWAAGGINFVGTSYAYQDYVTPTAWNATAQVDNDTFAAVPISANYTPSGIAASYSRSAPGVFTDIYGKLRVGFTGWSAGAVQA